MKVSKVLSTSAALVGSSSKLIFLVRMADATTDAEHSNRKRAARLSKEQKSFGILAHKSEGGFRGDSDKVGFGIRELETPNACCAGDSYSADCEDANEACWSCVKSSDDICGSNWDEICVCIGVEECDAYCASNNCDSCYGCGDGYCDPNEDWTCPEDCGYGSTTPTEGTTTMAPTSGPSRSPSRSPLQIDAPNVNFTITDPNGSSNDRLGDSVDIHGNNAIVGVPRDDNGNANINHNSGSARVYNHNGTAWVFDQKLNSTVSTDTLFGSQVAVHGDDAFVSFKSNGGGFSWFQRNGSLDPGVQWELKQRLTGNGVVPTSSGALCATDGDSMVFDGSKLVCGDNVQGYVFSFDQASDEEWAVEGTLQPGASTNCGDSSIAISGDTIVMGCRGHNSYNGTAFVFVRNAAMSDNGGWGSGTELRPNAYSAQGAQYGNSVGIDNIDGNKIIIGARYENTNGAAYIWEYEASSWSMEQRLGAEGARAFGWQVAISGDKAIVTSHDNIIKDGPTISLGGAARVFQQDSATGNWTMDEVIHSGSPQAGERFGYSLGWDGTNAIIGAPYSDGDTGAAYIHPVLSTPSDATPGPWKVEFRDIVANFTTTSDNEITNLYYVGRGRTVKTFLYQKGCTSKTPIAMQINTTTTKQHYNSTFDILTVSHSIDKSLIANNTQIWNSTSNNLEVCQVVELREEGIGEEDMVIITNAHELLIDFNLVVDYNTGSITLVQADNLEESTNTNVNDYISAFKCDGEQFAASTTPHLENTELNICIESESTDVVIDKVKTMIITQVVGGAGSDETWTIINEDDTVYKGLTSKTPVTGKGFFVTTYVPASMFSYKGNPITVTGQVELLLASGRKLKVNIDSMIDDAGKDRGLQVEGTEQAAFFGIDVALEPQAVVEDGINSATSTTGMTVFAGLVAIYSMW